MSTATAIPTSHTDPVNAQILSVSEDRIAINSVWVLGI